MSRTFRPQLKTGPRRNHYKRPMPRARLGVAMPPRTVAVGRMGGVKHGAPVEVVVVSGSACASYEVRVNGVSRHAYKGQGAMAQADEVFRGLCVRA